MTGISDAQRTALSLLSGLLEPTTYLRGGVAVALRLAHRSSRDLDFFVLASDPEPMPTSLTLEHWKQIKADLRGWVQRL